MCVFFFFKQKTAYEMRISDWSSDVCSSDLPVMFYNGATADARWRIGWISFSPDFSYVTGGGLEPLLMPPPAKERTDRKSVVEGKSVSVRVDLGGRRIIKKKKNIH